MRLHDSRRGGTRYFCWERESMGLSEEELGFAVRVLLAVLCLRVADGESEIMNQRPSITGSFCFHVSDLRRGVIEVFLVEDRDSSSNSRSNVAVLPSEV